MSTPVASEKKLLIGQTHEDMGDTERDARPFSARLVYKYEAKDERIED
jgi:hypothetical protein